MESQQFSQPKSFYTQLNESIGVKFFLIGVLTLILLIPSSWVQTLISERQQNQDDATTEIASKWSGVQIIESPAMQLQIKTLTKTIDTAGKTTFRDGLSTIYILPEHLKIKSVVTPEILHRGIFDVVVYNSSVNIEGNISPLELRKSGINPEMILWDKVKIVAGLTDFKGLKNSPQITIGDTAYTAEPDFAPENLFDNSLAVQLNLNAKKNTAVTFKYSFDLRGSGELSFMHLGRNTAVDLKGAWNNPSFTGNFLPERRAINNKQFSGSWKMTNFNRPFPQQWIGNKNIIKVDNKIKATFGVKFLLPVDQYQKITRSAKYAILVILLSFVSLFFIELLQKTSVSILHYLLIGAAMSIYYTLLLSFSEQVGFNVAYLIASLATITLVSTFIGAFLHNRKAAIAFSAILGIFYSFIYVIIQLQDLALLFGSIGLFIIVAVLMYFTVKVNWNKAQPSTAIA